MTVNHDDAGVPPVREYFSNSVSEENTGRGDRRGLLACGMCRLVCPNKDIVAKAAVPRRIPSSYSIQAIPGGWPKDDIRGTCCALLPGGTKMSFP